MRIVILDDAAKVNGFATYVLPPSNLIKQEASMYILDDYDELVRQFGSDRAEQILRYNLDRLCKALKAAANINLAVKQEE